MDRWTLPARTAAGLATIAISGMILALLALPALRARPPASWPELSGLAMLPGPEAAVRVDELAGRGDAAVAVWVPLLGDSRQEVAEAARRGLARRLDRWQLLDSRAAAIRVASLAQGLSRHVGDFGPDGRQRASDLVMRLLSWPLGADQDETRRLIDDCQAVLQSSDSSPRPLAGRLTEGAEASEHVNSTEFAGGGAESNPAADHLAIDDQTASPPPDARELPAEITSIPTLPDRRPQRSVAMPSAEPTDSGVTGESPPTVTAPHSDWAESRAATWEVPDQQPPAPSPPQSKSSSPEPLKGNSEAPPVRRLDLRR